MFVHHSWGWIVFDDTLHLSFVSLAIFLEEIVSVCLSWGFGIGLIEELLNSEEDLLNGDGRFPALFLVQDRQADRSRGIHVWMKQWWDEFAWIAVSALRHTRTLRE